MERISPLELNKILEPKRMAQVISPNEQHLKIIIVPQWISVYGRNGLGKTAISFINVI